MKEIQLEERFTIINTGNSFSDLSFISSKIEKDKNQTRTMSHLNYDEEKNLWHTKINIQYVPLNQKEEEGVDESEWNEGQGWRDR